MKQWHKKKHGYRHLGSHFAELTIMFSHYVQHKYTKLQKLPLDVSGSIMKLHSVQNGEY